MPMLGTHNGYKQLGAKVNKQKVLPKTKVNAKPKS